MRSRCKAVSFFESSSPSGSGASGSRMTAAATTGPASALRLAAAALGGRARVEFLDAGGLAAQLAQVEELGAADAAPPDDLDAPDDGTVQREDALDADAEARLPDRER